MKYTNNLHFPEFICQWLETDTYDYEEGTFSATTLMRPARQYALMKRYWDKLETDVADVIPLRFGTAMHDSIEKTQLKGCIQEKRMRTLVGDSIVTGKPDIMIEYKPWEKIPLMKIVDVKTTSVWTHIYKSKEEDHIKQLSIYKYIAQMNGYRVSEDALIWFIFTDWNKGQAAKGGNYPPARILVNEIELWDMDTTRQWIQERIAELDAAAQEPDKNLPKCSKEELWFNDKDGKAKRCGYCAARNFCEQYKDLVHEGKAE